jgi:hypothetical protein
MSSATGLADPTSLVIEVCKAADDLPTAASSGRLADFGPVDSPPPQPDP